MKRPGKKFLRVFGFLTLFNLLALVACFDTVDYRPYYREPYYSNTVARLQTNLATNSLHRGDLAAGFGQAKLTPTINAAQDEPAAGKFREMPLAGFGNRRGKPATGVHDDLFVKAVALRVDGRLGVMIGADALIIPPEVTHLAMAQLKQEFGLLREQVYLSATHTHCSLGGWGEGIVAESFAGGFQPGSRVWMADRIVAATRAAIADLKPAEYGLGHFSAPEFVRNRLVGALGKIDPEFTFALLKQGAGKSIVLGSYSAHATVLSSRTMEFSADYPGVWQRAVEAATGGAAIFFAGGVGSHGPVAGGSTFEAADGMGQALAKRLLAELPNVPLTNRMTFGTLGLEVQMPPLNVRLLDGIRVRPWLVKQLLPNWEVSYLQAYRLNDCVWISTPCDFSGELALGVKDLLRKHGRDAVVTSFNGDYIGYVVCPRYYHMNGYESRRMSFFGPYVPDYFVEMIQAMALDLVND